MAEQSEEEPGPSAPKRKKLQGAATYKSKFNPDCGQKSFPLLALLKGIPIGK